MFFATLLIAAACQLESVDAFAVISFANTSTAIRELKMSEEQHLAMNALFDRYTNSPEVKATYSDFDGVRELEGTSDHEPARRKAALATASKLRDFNPAFVNEILEVLKKSQQSRFKQLLIQRSLEERQFDTALQFIGIEASLKNRYRLVDRLLKDHGQEMHAMKKKYQWLVSVEALAAVIDEEEIAIAAGKPFSNFPPYSLPDSRLPTVNQWPLRLAMSANGSSELELTVSQIRQLQTIYKTIKRPTFHDDSFFELEDQDREVFKAAYADLERKVEQSQEELDGKVAGVLNDHQSTRLSQLVFRQLLHHHEFIRAAALIGYPAKDGTPDNQLLALGENWIQPKKEAITRLINLGFGKKFLEREYDIDISRAIGTPAFRIVGMFEGAMPIKEDGVLSRLLDELDLSNWKPKSRNPRRNRGG